MGETHLAAGDGGIYNLFPWSEGGSGAAEPCHWPTMDRPMSQFSHHVVRPLQNLWEGWRGRRDRQLLQARGLIPADYLTRRAQAARVLEAAYGEYVERVSTRKMAVSWETACLLYCLAGTIKPRAILDLGSGFSSYVLRTYAARAKHPCQVTSVDDDPHWLEQTRVYLQRHGLSAERLMLWTDFAAQAPAEHFELVFHDLGNMQTRLTALPVVLHCLHADGVLVLDDMHKRRFRRQAERQARQGGWQVASAWSETRDSIGRFSEIAWRRSA